MKSVAIFLSGINLFLVTSLVGCAPRPVIGSKPLIESLTPAAGASIADQWITFTTVCSDPDGWENLVLVSMVAKPSEAAKAEIWLTYIRSMNKVCLRDDTGAILQDGVAPGTIQILENSFIRLDAAQTTLQGAGNVLTIQWRVSFKSAAASTHQLRLTATDANLNGAVSPFGTWTVHSKDTTPPTTPAVTDDGAFTTSLTELHASWNASDPESDITGYRYAIGTAPEAQDVVPFTSAGIRTEVRHAGLSLARGAKYFISVKATNSAGLTSNPGISDGIRVNTEPPLITAVLPSDGSRLYAPDSVDFRITAIDPSGDPLQCRFLLDGQVLQGWTNSDSYQLETSGVSPGLKTLRVEVRDPFDGQDSRQVELYLYAKPLEARE